MGNTLRKSLSEVNSSIDTTQGKGWRKLLAFLGPAYWLASVIWILAIGQRTSPAEVVLVML